MSWMDVVIVPVFLFSLAGAIVLMVWAMDRWL